MDRHGEASMFTFGERGWLMGYRNRLWTMGEHDGSPADYYNDWPHTVKRFVVYMDWEQESIQGRIFEKRRHLDLITFTVICDMSYLLLRLQHWFLRTNARRKVRRLALAMALHPRLGRDSWLGMFDTDLVRGLVLAAA